MFYQHDLAMMNTADVTGGKTIAVWLQSISGGSAVNPLVAFYDIHGRKGGVLFIFPVTDTKLEIQILENTFSKCFSVNSKVSCDV
jgi:hypothetical protein